MIWYMKYVGLLFAGTGSITSMASKQHALTDGHFGPFRWLGDTDDHGKWLAA